MRISDIEDGIRSSFSYVGANNLSEYHSKVEFVRVTQAGTIEAKPHALLDKSREVLLVWRNEPASTVDKTEEDNADVEETPVEEREEKEEKSTQRRGNRE